MTQDPSSIAAARATAAATDRDLVEGVFRTIADHASRPAEALLAAEPWDSISRAEKGALRRDRAATLPRLLAIATGRGGEGEATRLFAASLLGEVDRVAGFRALLALLGADPALLREVLRRLWYQTLDDATKPALPALADSEADHLFGLLDHPDRRLADLAVDALVELRPPGLVERLRRFVADPDLGRAVRRELAKLDPQPDDLDRALDTLSTGGVDPLDRDSLRIVERCARGGTDPSVAGRAREVLRSLKDDPDRSQADRTFLEQTSRSLEHRDAIDASRPADLRRAAAIIDRIVAAGLIDPEAGREAITNLRGSPEGNWSKDPAWGASAAFEAARLRVCFDRESSDIPPPHDELVHDLAAASRGAFAPEAVFQLRGTGEDDYPVQFVHRGRLYRVMIADRGDWFDDEVIVAAANVALRDAGDSHRFVSLRTGDQSAELLFVEPERLKVIASDIGLHPEQVADPDVLAADALGDPSSQRLRVALRDLLPEADPGLGDAEFARARDDRGRTALHRAASRGRADLVEALVAAGADLSAADESGWTAMHRAAEDGQVAAIEALVAAGADVDGRDPDGWAPLHMAACRDQPGAIAALLDRGAIRRARDRRGFTPLHTAANSNAPAATALLLDRGDFVDVRTREVAPSEGAPRTGLTTTKALAWAGWHIGGKAEEGQTPLHRAAFRGGDEVVELLLDRGADIDAVDARLQTPLHLAVAGDRTRAAEILRARGADPARRDDQGRTPAGRAGDSEAYYRDMRRGMRKLLWAIRLIKILTFPVRVGQRILRRIAGSSS